MNIARCFLIYMTITDELASSLRVTEKWSCILGLN